MTMETTNGHFIPYSRLPEELFLEKEMEQAFDLIEQVDQMRVEATLKLDQSKRGQFGQFLTSAPIA